MSELRCKDCGQTFTSPDELADHAERTHERDRIGGTQSTPSVEDAPRR